MRAPARHRQLLLPFACLLWQALAEGHKLPSGLSANALQPWRSDVADASSAWSTRRLQQQPALSPGPAQPATGSAVVSIISNSTNYWPYLCVDSCSQAFQCVWQNVWAWSCQGTVSYHNYWVWEPSGLIRAAATDSFSAWPLLCMDMCQDASPSKGACSMTDGVHQLNVGWLQCTGYANQLWEMQPSGTITNAANGFCLTLAPSPCGHLGACRPGLNMTYGNGTVLGIGAILNIVAEPCNGSPEQVWHVQAWTGVSVPAFVPLNVSEAEALVPDPSIVQSTVDSQAEVVYLQAGQDMCLAVENRVSCADQTREGAVVCAWRNVMLQPCQPQTEAAGFDQLWAMDNETSAVVAAGSLTLADSVCLEACVNGNYAQGACSLVDSNVGWGTCTGLPEQQWSLVNGFLASANGQCLHMQPYCVLGTTYATADPSALTQTVDGFALGDCQPQNSNKPYSQVPYNGSSYTVTGIQNVVLGPCSQTSENNSTAANTAGSTLLSFTTKSVGNAYAPLRPAVPVTIGIPSKTEAAIGASSGQNTSAVVAGCVVAVTLVAVGVLLFVCWRKRWRRRVSDAGFKGPKYEVWPEDVESFEGKTKMEALTPGGSRLEDNACRESIARFMDRAYPFALASKREALGSNWGSCLIPPEELEICKRSPPHDASLPAHDWKLGSGAFGTVFKGLRNGVQPVAVKVLNDYSPQQLASFGREIQILRSLHDTNVVQFLGVCQQQGRVLLVTEFMAGGNLYDAIASGASDLGWYQRGRRIALDVVKGLVHLHSQKIIHLDMKSSNILLVGQKLNAYLLNAKIADVGLSRFAPSGFLSHLSKEGTRTWSAPEVLSSFRDTMRDPGQRSRISLQADVFSFGVVLWEIVTQADPVQGWQQIRVPQQCPQAVADLVEACTREDPEERPRMTEVYHVLKAAANQDTCGPPALPAGSLQLQLAAMDLAARNDSAMESQSRSQSHSRSPSQQSQHS